MRTTNRRRLSVVTFVTTIILVASLAAGSMPAAAAPPDPPVSGGPPPIATGPSDWNTGSEFDNDRTGHVPQPLAEDWSKFWTAMFMTSQYDNPQFRAQLSQLGLTVAADTGGDTGAETPTGLQAYLDSDLGDISAALFRPFSVAEQKYLVVYLVEYWYRYVPGFAQAMQLSATNKGMSPLELARALAVTIWSKDKFKRGLGNAFGGDRGADSELGGPPEPGQLTVIDEAAAALDEAAVGVLGPDAAGLNIVPPDALELVDRLLEYVPPVNPDVVVGQVNYAVALAGAMIADPPDLADVQGILDQAMYTACANLPGRAPSCRTQPLGFPATFNLDAVVTPDVKVTLLVDPTASPGGLGGRLEATRLTAAGTTAIVTTRMYIDQAQGFVNAGFNGLPTPFQSATIGLDNPFAALQGDIQLRSTVTHTGLPTALPTLTLTGGYTQVDDAGRAVDTTNATIKFEKAPTLLLVRARLFEKRIEATWDALNSSPKVTASVTRATTAPKTTMSATVVVDKLPDHAQIVIDTVDDVTTVNYNATEAINSLSAAMVSSAPTGTTTLAASFTGVPASIAAKLDRERIEYTASSRLPAASAARTFTAPNGQANHVAAALTGVPTQWSVETSGEPMVVRYNANEPITRISGSYSDQATKRAATVVVDQVPAGLTTLTLRDDGVSYAAPAPITRLAGTAKVLGFDIGLTLTGIPRQWSVTFDDGGLNYQASEDGLTSLSATLTNHGIVNRPAGNHVSFNVAERNTAAGVVRDVNASLLITKVKRLSVRTGEPAVTSIEAGGGAPLRTVATLKRVNGLLASVDATLTPLPQKVDLSIGRATTVSTSQNFDLRASVRYSESAAALTSLGFVPTVHGVTIRDGLAGDKEAFGAELYLTGLPTLVQVGTGSFVMRGFRPKVSTLAVDIELDKQTPEPITAYASITGLPVTSALDLDVSTVSRPIAEGGTELEVVVDSFGKVLGQLKTKMRRGATGGILNVQSIPSRIEATLTELEGQTVVDWKAAPISLVYAEFQHANAAGTLGLAGKVTMQQIPGNITLTAGRDPEGGGPLLSYHAGAAGMDVAVWANGSLKKPNSALAATLDFVITDLAKDVELTATADKVQLAASSKITLIGATVSAAYSYNKQGRGTLNEGSWLSFPYEYRVGVGASVSNFVVALRGATSLVLEPGVISKVGGAFDSFDFGWKNLRVTAGVYGAIKARIDWPSPLGVSTIRLAQASFDVAVNDIKFHRYASATRDWVKASVPVMWFCTASVTTRSKPGRDGTALGSTGVHFNNPATVGGTYYVVPNPAGVVPDPFVDVAAFALSDPHAFGATFGLSC